MKGSSATIQKGRMKGSHSPPPRMQMCAPPCAEGISPLKPTSGSNIATGSERNPRLQFGWNYGWLPRITDGSICNIIKHLHELGAGRLCPAIVDHPPRAHIKRFNSQIFSCQKGKFLNNI